MHRHDTRTAYWSVCEAIWLMLCKLDDAFPACKWDDRELLSPGPKGVLHIEVAGLRIKECSSPHLPSVHYPLRTRSTEFETWVILSNFKVTLTLSISFLLEWSHIHVQIYTNKMDLSRIYKLNLSCTSEIRNKTPTH